jgi:trehalose 6-phosphate synthase/phosphatase
MGVDARAFAAVAAEPSVEEEVKALRGGDETRLLVGVDRLDYTKGIPRRLLAFERLLENHPELHGSIRLVQVAVPSREDVRAYQAFRSRAYELVGRIHGRFATPHWVPIYWIYRHLTREAVVALYRAADVMLVTPIRDGMNLVAKEFVASRTDGDGVLVLSEFAGAASELAEALLVNPFDEVGTAEAFHQAIRMPEDERKTRMRALRRRVFGFDVERWARAFVTTLQQIEKMEIPRGRTISTREEIESLAERMRHADHLLLLLDFDGTIVPFTDSPELAKPDSPLIDLLAGLAARPGCDVHVVSSRSRDTLARWLGWLPIGLHVEHGMWSRAAHETEWVCADEPGRDWHPAVISILEDWSARTPGSFVEEKSTCVAWHYRAADAEFAEHQAKELHVHLRDMLSNVPVEILSGDKVIEVRPHGAHKGRIVAPLLAKAPPGTLVVAMGDDRSDEDLFEALPEEAIAIHVGPRQSRAPYRLATVDDARALLASLLGPDDESGGAPDKK